MSVIITKYLPATYARGARVKASLAKGWGARSGDTITVEWDWSLDGWQNHLAAAETLARKLELWGRYYRVDAGDSGYLFARDNAIGTGFEADPDLVPISAELADA